MNINVSDLKKNSADKFILAIKASYSPEIVGEPFNNSIIKFKYPPIIKYRIDVKFKIDSDYIFSLAYHPSIENKNLTLTHPLLVDPNIKDHFYVCFKYILGPNDIYFSKKENYLKIDNERIYKKGEIIANCIFIKKNYFFVEK